MGKRRTWWRRCCIIPNWPDGSTDSGSAVAGTGPGGIARELIILRLAWRISAVYEWPHHVRLARSSGVSQDDVDGVIVGHCESWSQLDGGLIAATDQLLDSYRIDNGTWTRLTKQLNEQQLVEVPFVMGTYVSLAMAFDSWSVQVECGINVRGIPTIPEDFDRV